MEKQTSLTKGKAREMKQNLGLGHTTLYKQQKISCKTGNRIQYLVVTYDEKHWESTPLLSKIESLLQIRNRNQLSVSKNNRIKKERLTVSHSLPQRWKIGFFFLNSNFCLFICFWLVLFIHFGLRCCAGFLSCSEWAALQWGAGFSLWLFLLLQSVGSGHLAFSSRGAGA